MIEIKLLNETSIAELCDKIGVNAPQGLLVYAAIERGEPLGCCGFIVDGENGALLFTHMEQDGLSPIEDGLLRASLSMMYEHGVLNADCKGGIPEIRLRALGFKQKDDVYKLNFKNSFLTQECHCAAKKE